MSTTRVLGIFAKEPRPGQVKTRLAAATSPEFACAVALAFVTDAIEKVRAYSAKLVLAYTPEQARSVFVELAANTPLELEAQGPGDLGERMLYFFEGHTQEGVRAVLIGTDSPTLPIQFVDEAFAALDHADIVLGPATDGGYYLIGCKDRAPPIFDGVSWSGHQVLRDTVRRVQDAAMRLALLPPWYDIDTLEDWQMLKGHIAAQRAAGIDPRAAATEKTISDFRF